MPDKVRILNATRIYEFEPDAIALSIISTDRVGRVLSSALGIPSDAAVTLGSPISTELGGVIFQQGSITDHEQTIVVRRLLIQPRLLSITVVESSSRSTDTVLHVIRNALSSVKTSTNRPIIGDYKSIRDHSELTAHLDFPSNAPFSTEFMRAVTLPDVKPEWAWGLTAVAIANEQPYPGDPQPNLLTPWWHLSPRQGTKLEDRIYYSAAPLDTEAHEQLLAQVENSLVRRAE